MDTILYLVLTALYVMLVVYGIILWNRDSSHGLRYLLFLVTLALIWDNGIMGIGKWLGEGEALEAMNLLRFWLHAFCTPLLTLISFDLIQKSGAAWVRKSAFQWIAWIFTAALILLELVTETLSLEIKPLSEFGALRYVPAEEATGPPLMVLLVLIPLFAAGIVLWKRKVTTVLFWGTLIMTLGSAIPLPLESSAITNIFELLLISSLWFSIHKLIRYPGKHD